VTSVRGVESFMIVKLIDPRYEGCWITKIKGIPSWLKRLGLEDYDIMSKGRDSLALLIFFAKA